MPNWCSNELIVRGEEELVSKLINDLEAPAWFLPNPKESWLGVAVFYPPPPWDVDSDLTEGQKAFARTMQHIGSKEVLDHSGMVGKFSCKWDIDLEIYNEGDDFFNASFNSAWGPPIYWAVRLAHKYKVSIELRYEEAGADFAGVVVIDQCDNLFKVYSTEWWPWTYVFDKGLFRTQLEELEPDLREEIEKEAESWAKTEEEYLAQHLKFEGIITDIAEH